nr:PREDICTED: retinaldehyde-binding protein 1-like [Bemisia tabaci]
MGSDDSVIVPPEEQIESDLEHLKEWMAKQPHLPLIKDEEWLKTCLYNNKFSLEKTKSKLENYYTFRSKYPHILKNRDPTGPDMLKAREFIKFGLGQKRLKDGSLVLFIKYCNPNAFDANIYAKRVFMNYDMIVHDPSNRLTRLVSIIDLQDFSSVHALKLMSVMGTISEIFNLAYVSRTKAVHLLNFPSFASPFLEAMKKFFPAKMTSRIRPHPPGDRTLFETVDEDVVCSDFGGKGPTLAELEDEMQKKLEKIRGWFEEEENLCSNESLRRKDFNQVEEMRGSFRKLEVD